MKLKPLTNEQKQAIVDNRNAMVVASKIRDLAWSSSVDKIDMEICLQSADNVKPNNYRDAIAWAKQSFNLNIEIR